MKVTKKIALMFFITAILGGCGPEGPGEGTKFDVESDVPLDLAPLILKKEFTETTRYVIGDDGLPVKKTDENGNPIQATDELGDPAFEVDNNGSPIYYDVDGNEVPAGTDGAEKKPIYEYVPNQDRYGKINLLEGVRSNGIELTVDSIVVLIQQMQTVKDDFTPHDEDHIRSLVLPSDSLLFEWAKNVLLVDRSVFEDTDINLLNNELHTGESITYTLRYWINNGFKFQCENMDFHPVNCTDEELIENNPNLRTLEVTIKGNDDPLVALKASEPADHPEHNATFTTKVGKTVDIASLVTKVPSYGFNPGFTWQLPAESDVVNIDENGIIHALTPGEVNIEISSSAPGIDSAGINTVIVNFNVLPLPDNVDVINIQDADNNTITDLSMDACDNTFLTATATPDSGEEVTGFVEYDWTSDAPNSILSMVSEPNTGYIAANLSNDEASTLANVKLNALLIDAQASDNVTNGEVILNFTTNNLACTEAFNGNFDLLDDIDDKEALPWQGGPDFGTQSTVRIQAGAGRSGNENDNALNATFRAFDGMVISATDAAIPEEIYTIPGSTWEISFWVKSLTTDKQRFRIGWGRFQDGGQRSGNLVMAEPTTQWQRLSWVFSDTTGEPQPIAIEQFWGGNPRKLLIDDIQIRRID